MFEAGLVYFLSAGLLNFAKENIGAKKKILKIQFFKRIFIGVELAYNVL